MEPTTSHAETTTTTTATITNHHQYPPLESVLGLRCLSIVLSYLEECEGTSLLLTQKRYWTDTILPLLRVSLPPQKNATSPNTNTSHSAPTSKKHRHRFWGKNHAPAIRIPDASTRLDRLNTRRWNTRQRTLQRQLRIQQFSNNDNGKELLSHGESDVEHLACPKNLTMSRIANAEWEETVAQDDETDPIARRRRSILMNPPLLQFYNPSNHRQTLFRAGTTCLASYPRSGNTLLRSLLETVTGFVTSSDTRPDRNLSVALAERPPYFVGEGLAPPNRGSSTPSSHHPIPQSQQQQQQQQQSPQSPFLPPQSETHTDARVRLPAPPICKTHWPERVGCHSYECHRVILLVRNPFDATDSYWHMNLTKSHTEKVQPQITQEHKAFYEALVRHEILQVWTVFLDFYWKECSKHKVPLLLVRYEDLVLHPNRELERILGFCCKSGDGEEDWWKARLEEVTRDSNATSNDNHNDGSTGGEKRKTDKYGYRSSSSMVDDSVQDQNPSAAVNSALREGGGDSSCAATKPTSTTDNSGNSGNAQPMASCRSSHPSIGRSLRRGMFPENLLKTIHEFDDHPPFGKLRRERETENPVEGRWLERLGYHVYKQGFPNNLDKLPPVPVLELSGESVGSSSSGRLTMNIPDVSLELRPRDSPYGRNMTKWRRERTAKDTQPFPII